MKVDLKMVAERLRESKGMRWGSWKSDRRNGNKKHILYDEIEGLRFTHFHISKW